MAWSALGHMCVPMIRLVHYSVHVPADPDPVLRRLTDDPRHWLGVDALENDLVVIGLKPAGLLEDPDATLSVRVELGPVADTEHGLLRRLSYDADGLVPRTRCDLTVTRTPGNGVRFRLQGEYRSIAAAQDRDLEFAAAESIAQPLVRTIVEHTTGARFAL